MAASKVSHSGRDPYKGKKFRWWFFTWNNPSHPSDKERLVCAGYTYIKFQYERGESGTLHYQGVLYVSDMSSCSALQRKFPYSYLAPVRSRVGAVNYCGKEESRVAGPWEHGKPPAPGRRNDLEEVKASIDSGTAVDDLWSEYFASCVRYHRSFSVYHGIVHKDDVRKWQTVCYVYHGSSGCGKTEAAKEESRVFGGGTYWLTLEKGAGGKVWWDGYAGEQNVVIDEFACQIPFSEFKRLIDSSPLRLPVKGGFVNFLARRVWICSNHHVDLFYYKVAIPGPMRESLLRRMHYVEQFDIKFQGQPDYESFLFLRSEFVQSQRAGVYKIKVN
jgi:RNA helicase